MRRGRIIALISVGLLLFLVISALLARAFSVSGAEDSALTDLVKAEARGDRSAVISDIKGCRKSPACQARASANIAALRRPGSVQIIEINASAGFSLGSTLGTARVAWLVGSSLPRVQCVRVRHSGNVLAGYQIELLKVSVRIHSNADCPSHF
jgi:hypothetical protein